MTVSDTHYTITVCGQPEIVRPQETVQEYLTQKGINPGRVVVEVNRRILPREEYDKYCFQPGDEVEIVHFVGGGSR